MHFAARITFVPLFLAAAASGAESGGALPKRSPFELRGQASAPVATVHETIEFAGVSSIGDKTDLIFHDKSSKKSHWISPGDTKEGIEVIKYDEGRDEAVVKLDGVEKTLALRKASGPVGSPRPVPAMPGGFNTLPAPLPAVYSAQPAAVNVPLPSTTEANGNPTELQAGTAAAKAPSPAAGSPAEIQARQETEARMLVSDLLEIGMAQRRAYEEAQRKAAAGKSEPAETPQMVPAQPTPPNQ